MIMLVKYFTQGKSSIIATVKEEEMTFNEINCLS